MAQSSEVTAEQVAIAFHEAGHAVAAVLLGMGSLLRCARVISSEDGRGPGVDLSGDAWPRGPATKKPEDVSDENWAEMKANPCKWNEWVAGDHDRFAVYYLAGEAAQRRHSGGSLKQFHETDHSHVKRLVPDDRVPRLEEDARVLIATHWPAVELLAAALIGHGQLGGRQVEVIVASAQETRR